MATIDNVDPNVGVQSQHLDCDRSLREVVLPYRLLLFQSLSVEGIHQGNRRAGEQGEKSLSSLKTTLGLLHIVRWGAVAVEEVHENLESGVESDEEFRRLPPPDALVEQDGEAADRGGPENRDHPREVGNDKFFPEKDERCVERSEQLSTILAQ